MKNNQMLINKKAQMKINFSKKFRVNQDKTGQMKIQQMAFMLLAVFLFFVLIGMMILSFKFSNLKEEAAILEEKNALLLVSKLSNSPEFSCGEAFGTTKVNCIDMDKVFVLKQYIGDYANFWGVENIEIRKIYPSLAGEFVCDNENYPDCNIIRLISDTPTGVGISNFVALCRIEEGNPICDLGKIIVSYETI